MCAEETITRPPDPQPEAGGRLLLEAPGEVQLLALRRPGARELRPRRVPRDLSPPGSAGWVGGGEKNRARARDRNLLPTAFSDSVETTEVDSQVGQDGEIFPPPPP